MKSILLFLIIGLSSTPLQSSSDQWDILKEKFLDGYNTLNIAPLHLSYQQNLEGIKNSDSISIQKSFFINIQREVSQFNVNNFSKNEKLNYDLLNYEIQLNLERLELEEKWVKKKQNINTTDGLSTVTNGKEWYAYFLKKWVDNEATPDAMFAFGLKEIEKVKNNMKTIQLESGMDSVTFEKYLEQPNFFFTNVDSIQSAFEELKIEMNHNAIPFFPHVNDLPEVNIQQGKEERMAIAPAYYMNNTFFYNYFNKPYNKRQIAWIYLHEAVPGHHYQNSLEKITQRSSIQKNFEYFGYMEGYAAYVEELGEMLGAYKTPYDAYGKWEWDLIRSVRVSMDVGLNYYHWSDEEALSFWQKYIQGQDDIAQREIARMKRWPAQVITYKYGGGKILEWKENAAKKEGFKLLDFHQSILQFGSIPFSILEKYI